MRKPTKEVTPELFICIKELLALGSMTQAQIGGMVDVADGTVSEINRSENYEDYKKKCKEKWEKLQKNKKNEKDQSQVGKDEKTALTRYEALQIMGTLREQNKQILELQKMMETMSKKVVFLVEQLS